MTLFLAPYQQDVLVQEILADLHENIQFYDDAGHPANVTVLEKVEGVLRHTLARLSPGQESRA
jgi:hypothetical protein